MQMNAKIQALWARAGGHCDAGDQHHWPTYTIDDPAQFAQLIVQECVNIVDRMADHVANASDPWTALGAVEEVGIDIQEHFDM